jgi:hypothetical protein
VFILSVVHPECVFIPSVQSWLIFPSNRKAGSGWHRSPLAFLCFNICLSLLHPRLFSNPTSICPSVHPFLAPCAPLRTSVCRSVRLSPFSESLLPQASVHPILNHQFSISLQRYALAHRNPDAWRQEAVRAGTRLLAAVFELRGAPRVDVDGPQHALLAIARVEGFDDEVVRHLLGVGGDSERKALPNPRA